MLEKWKSIPGCLANIYIDGKSRFLGTFYTAEEASEAYRVAAERADES